MQKTRIGTSVLQEAPFPLCPAAPPPPSHGAHIFTPAATATLHASPHMQVEHKLGINDTDDWQVAHVHPSQPHGKMHEWSLMLRPLADALHSFASTLLQNACAHTCSCRQCSSSARLSCSDLHKSACFCVHSAHSQCLCCFLGGSVIFLCHPNSMRGLTRLKSLQAWKVSPCVCVSHAPTQGSSEGAQRDCAGTIYVLPPPCSSSSPHPISPRNHS